MRRRCSHLLVGATLVTAAIFFTWMWFWKPTSILRPATGLQPGTPSPLLPVRGSANLSDGTYTYHLNLSLFQSEFPLLQSYRCSLTLAPQRARPEGDNVTRPLLLLGIKSHPRSGARRAALRQTWAREGQVAGFWVRTIFLMGESEVSGHMNMVREESRAYGDVLQWDFTEGHHNLSLKERCFLAWLHNQHPRAAFIFKGDDDEYVNPEAVAQYVTEHGGSPVTLHGALQRHANVMRYSKYRVSETLYPLPVYPIFLSGGGYIFPGGSVGPLYEASHTLPVFPLDDVYFGFLALAANLNFRHDAHFYVYGLAFEPCQYRRALVVHGVGPERLLEVWKDVQSARCEEGAAGGR